jgi:2-hydroxy-6-oxonona-2,4-dienedioate hydrolase
MAEPGPVRERWHRIHGLNVHSLIAEPEDGTGVDVQDLVLVHGLGMSAAYLRPLIRRLAARYRVHAPDLAGSGRSDRPTGPIGVLDWSDMLMDWMTAAGIGRAALVGHSLGSVVAGYLAVEHPERADCLVMVSPSPDPDRPSVRQQFGSLVWDGLQEPAAMVLLSLRDYWRYGPVRLVRTLRDAIRTILSEVQAAPPDVGRLRQLRQPTLVVYGERDRVVTLRWSRRLSRMLPNGRLVVMSDATHAMNYGAPDALADTIEPFLDLHLGPADDRPDRSRA